MDREQDGTQPVSMAAADRASRSSRLVVVGCQREYGPEVSIKIRNTSATGLRGDCGEVADFREGETVLLMFRNTAPIAASVAWCKNGQVAFTFGTAIEIDRVLLVHTRAALPEQSPRSETTLKWIERTERQRAYIRSKLNLSDGRPV